MNLFLYSSNYMIECLVPNAEYVFNKKIDNLYIYDNEEKSDVVKIENKNCVKVSNDVELCIKNSEITVIIEDGYTSKRFTETIIDICKRLNQKYYSIKISQKESRGFILPIEIVDKRKPVILVCYHGNSTKVEKLELSFCRRFFDSNVLCFKLLSPITNSVITEIFKTKDYNNLSANIDYDVVLITLDLARVANNDIEIYSTIVSAHPDFMCDNNFTEFQEIQNLFKYKLNIKVDFIIKSNLISYIEDGQLYRIKTNTIFENNFPNVFDYTNEIEDYIYKVMMSKITRPNLVKAMN